MAKKSDHLHKYEKIRLGTGDYVVFRCTFPQCSHYIRSELAKGKVCLCNRCNGPMVLDTAAMQLTKPHCKNCTLRKDRPIASGE